jgi:hypothetical protein
VPRAISFLLVQRHDADPELQTFIDDAAERFAATESDFKKKWFQAQYLISATKALQEIIWISSALRTSLKVLGDDMPHAEEARQYESKATKTMNEGYEMANRLKMYKGKVLKGNMADHTLVLADKAKALA